MLKKILVYLAGNIASKAIVFLLLPIYTANFTPEKYGTIDIIILTLSTIISFSFIEIWQAVIRFMYDEEELNGKYSIFLNAILLTIPLALVYSFAVFLMSKYIKYDFYYLVYLYGIILLITNIYQFFTRGVGQNTTFVISGLLSNLLEVCLNLFFVLLLHFGVESILISGSIAKLISIIYLEINTKPLINIKFENINIRKMKEMLVYSIPLSINSIAFWGMSSLNRLISYKFLRLDENGYLAVANKFTSIISIIVTVFILAWQETALENRNKQNRSKLYSDMFDKYLVVLSLFTSIVLIFTKLIFPWFIDFLYQNALTIIPLSFFGSYISGISSFYGPLFGVEKKTNIIFYSTLLGAVSNIIVLYILLPQLGILSVPISLSIGFIFNTLSRYIYIKKYIDIKIHKENFILSSIVIITTILIAQFSSIILLDLLNILVIIVLFIYKFKSDFRILINKLKI